MCSEIPKAEVASLAEVALPQLVLLDLETALEDLLCLGSADGDVHGDLLVTADTEGSDGVACFACCFLRQSGVLVSCPLLLKRFMVVVSYCRRVFDRSTAPTLWLLASTCHQTRRRRC